MSPMRTEDDPVAQAAELEKSDPEKAAALYRQSLDAGRHDSVIYCFLVRRATDWKNWAEGRALGTAGLVHHPHDAELLYLTGRCLNRSGRSEQAEPLLRTSATAKPNADASLEHGNCLMLLGRYREAVAVLSEQLARDDSHALVWSARGFARWGCESASDGLGDVQEAARRAPDNSSVRTDLARILSALQRGEEARREIEEAVRLSPDNVEVKLAAIQIRGENGGRTEAIAELRSFLTQFPSHLDALYRLGTFLREAGDYEEAMEVFDEFRMQGGGELATLQGLGLCAYALQDWELTHECYSRATELDANFIDTYRAYCAIAATNLGEIDSAQAMFDAILAANPRCANTLSHRGAFWNSQDEFDKAIADFTLAIEYEPELAAHRDWRGGIYEILDAHANALADVDALVRLQPDNVNHLWRRAELRDKLGDTAGADTDAAAAEVLEHIEPSDEPEEDAMLEDRMKLWAALQAHFGEAPLDQITLTERNFPVQVGADLQKALDSFAAAGIEICQFWATQWNGAALRMISDAYVKNRRNPVRPAAPRYLEIDVGEVEPVRALRDGLWLLKTPEGNLALILDTLDWRFIRFQIAALTSAGPVAGRVFQHLEATVKLSPSYRGKILSLEPREMYTGQNQGLRVHTLRTVPREDVILPKATLDQLDRNVTRFVEQRARLVELGLSGKKGLLFHGPPGTGKTHTIHYLAQSVKNQTTFIISADQVAILGEYMTLARLYQPSLIVIEDVDLIARQREDLRSAHEEALLNRLLNEMDGLQTESQILFVLTTNRPEALEEALASRPGRIDQAIAFPLPDEDGRGKLARLYSGKLALTDKIVRQVVARTAGFSASFIKELMRRSAQFALERGEAAALIEHDVETALEEMLLLGGTLNRKLLGFAGAASE